MATKTSPRPAPKPSRAASTKTAAVAPDPQPSEKPANKSSGNTAVNWLRGIVAGLLGLVAAYFIVAAPTLYWFNHSLTNQDKFKSLTAPLATNTAVQKFVVQKVTDNILDNTSVNDLATNFLTPSQAAVADSIPTDQVKAAAEPQVKATVNQIVTSPQFAQLWTTTTTNTQTQAMSFLNGDTNSTVISFKPTVDGLINLLQGTKLSFLQPKDISSKSAQVTIKADQAKKFRDGYKHFKNAATYSAIIAVITTALMILIARKRVHAVRHLSIIVALVFLLTALIIRSLSHLKVTGGDIAAKQAAVAVANTTLHGLQQIDFICGLVALAVFLLTFTVGPLKKRMANRDARARTHEFLKDA